MPYRLALCVLRVLSQTININLGTWFYELKYHLFAIPLALALAITIDLALALAITLDPALALRLAKALDLRLALAITLHTSIA